MGSSQSTGAPGHEGRLGATVERRWNSAAQGALAVFAVAFVYLAYHYVLVGGQYLRIVLP